MISGHYMLSTVLLNRRKSHSTQFLKKSSYLLNSFAFFWKYLRYLTQSSFHPKNDCDDISNEIKNDENCVNYGIKSYKLGEVDVMDSVSTKSGIVPFTSGQARKILLMTYVKTTRMKEPKHNTEPPGKNEARMVNHYD